MRAIVLVAMAACSSPDERQGLSEREHVYSVRGGEFVELLVELSEGTTLVCDWSASTALSWETHSHPLGMLEVYEAGIDASGVISLVATVQRPYGVQWSNFADVVVDVRVTLDLPADATLLEW